MKEKMNEKRNFNIGGIHGRIQWLFDGLEIGESWVVERDVKNSCIIEKTIYKRISEDEIICGQIYRPDRDGFRISPFWGGAIP